MLSPATPYWGFDVAQDLELRSPEITVNIGFGLLPGGSGTPFTTYEDTGVTVAAVSGIWEVFGYGNPGPAVGFQRLAADPTISAQVQISAGGSLFRFTSVDLYSSVTNIPYKFTGLVNSIVVFTVDDVRASTAGNYRTVANPNQADLIDALLIELWNPATPCCRNPVGFDNVVLIR